MRMRHMHPHFYFKNIQLDYADARPIGQARETVF